MTVPETLGNLIDASSLVVEGKVRSQQGFYDTDNKNIYTVNDIEVFKIFQGLPTITEIKIVTRGGVVTSDGASDFEMDRVSNALELEVGEMGTFMLQAFPGNLPLDGNLYRPTEGVLGFVRYDLVIGEAQGVFDRYPEISNQLYSNITSRTGLSILDINPWDAEDENLNGEPSVERSIVSGGESGSNANFQVHAGVGDRLTITGTDFGREPGSVLFPDANSGGRRYISTLDHQIISWTDERIELQVPYRAGTGKVRIDKANGESLIGDEPLPIGYDHINVRYTDENGRKAYETQLTSDNGKGGYDFQFEADFAANTGASQAFGSLLETWACTTGVNFHIGDVTEVDEDANDGINIVRFDNGNELGGRTLAYARSRYRGCYQDGTIKWFVNEIEVVVNDDYDWYYGDGMPGATQFDFETVMLHEIGHTQQLGHVINGNEVMHFAVGPGQQKRSLSHIDSIGGAFVTTKSTAEAVCGRDLMEHFGGCCETMAIISEPISKTLCPEDTTVSFEFPVDFGETWQWQIKNGPDWSDINNNDTYLGTDSRRLTIMASGQETAEFRCRVKNSCDESVTSTTVQLSKRQMDFAVTSEPADCDGEGQIMLDRNSTEGIFEVSTDGADSFEIVWPADDATLSISATPDTYKVVIKDAETGCSVNLGAITVAANPLPDATVETLTADCEGLNGALLFQFGEHPDYEQVAVSLDGGATYPYAFDTTSEESNRIDLSADTYDLTIRWDGSSCHRALGSFTIEREDPESANCSAEENEENEQDTDTTGENNDIPDNADTHENDENPYDMLNPKDSDDAVDSKPTTVTVYPNPTNQRIYITGGEGDFTKFQLFSAKGILVHESSPQRFDTNVFFMDIAHAHAGVYILHIRKDRERIFKKVIIK